MVYITNFGFDDEGNDLEYLGTEFDSVEEISELCKEYGKKVTPENHHAYES